MKNDQAVECLPNTCKALGSIPSTPNGQSGESMGKFPNIHAYCQ